MWNKEWIGFASLGFGIIGNGLYAWSLIKKHSKPHAFSWGIWGVLTGVAYFAQASADAGPGAWSTAMTAFFCLCVAAWALFRGENNITRSDWAALAGAFATLPLWYVTRDPLLAVFLIVIIDGLGFWPTFRKSWNKPYDEMLATYVIGIIKFALSLMAIRSYSAVTVIYPLFILVSNALFVAMAKWRRRVIRAPA
jgi:hypothetical protein